MTADQIAQKLSLAILTPDNEEFTAITVGPVTAEAKAELYACRAEYECYDDDVRVFGQQWEGDHDSGIADTAARKVQKALGWDFAVLVGQARWSVKPVA